MMKNREKTFQLIAVCMSALLQTYTIQVFVQPSNLLSSGFTGVAILIQRITLLFGIDFSVSLGMIALNIPIALFCYKHIGKRFVISSMFQVFLASIFLQIFDFTVIFEDVFLNVVFGGFLYGFAIVLALKGNSSTAGTDFIALYVSNKKGKAIWEYVLIFNCLVLCVSGYLFGWIYAGYSIVFQYISSKTISTFYQRYKRVTLQITTKKAKEVVDSYIEEYRHGISVMNGYGGYSGDNLSLLHTVVSAYEVHDIISLMKSKDKKIIVNVLPTEEFVGGFYQRPME